ncbi:MAG: DUF2934 domain-containing protein [Planctomycetes bacterium]|nr:DUF2934 domain-containing protein [Planctomycetota bacterium]
MQNSNALPEASSANGYFRELDPEAIRTRAYALYQARQGQAGSAEDDWTRAEQELRGEAGGASRCASLHDEPIGPKGGGLGVAPVHRKAAAVLFIGG